jgi:3-oxoacyl-[acyl-carrier-protein] synthase II
VTGLGLVSPLGVGTDQTWQAILASRSGIAPITLFDPARDSARFAGEVKGFDPLEWLDRKDVKTCGRFIQFEGQPFRQPGKRNANNSPL